MRKSLLMVLVVSVVALCGCGSAPLMDDSQSASTGGTVLRPDSSPGSRDPVLYTLF